MKKPEGYIKSNQRKTILLLSDDVRLPSGVANMGRELILGTAHIFNWYNLGAAKKHPDEGKVFDVSADINTNHNIPDADVKIQASTGYGSEEVVMELLERVKPDVILLFTDPRYYKWLFKIKEKVNKYAPIAYLNIWDAPPAPMYNKEYYQACDLLMAISKQTKNLNEVVLGEEAQDKIIDYLPHGVNLDTFKPIKDAKKISSMRSDLFKRDDIDFVVFWNSRNIQRKVPGNVVLAYNMFCDLIGKEAASKCALVMHTTPIDTAGTNLVELRDTICDKTYQNVFFSGNKIDQNQMNLLYNVADVTMLTSSNEGWGLSLTESMMAGTPIIANVTGGMQDQMRFVNEEGNWIDFDKEFQSNHKAKYKECGDWAKPVFPSNISLVGTVPTPYIYDDRCSPEDVAEAINYWYSMNKSERKKRGQLGRKWVTSKESGMSSKNMCNNFVNSINKLFN